MYSKTTPGLRVAALVGAGSVTASLLLGLALLAQPALPVADQPTRQGLVANTAASPAAEQAIERLRIRVIGTRDPSLATAPVVVPARAECPDATTTPSKA